jgi:hypothetical protein
MLGGRGHSRGVAGARMTELAFSPVVIIATIKGDGADPDRTR